MRERPILFSAPMVRALLAGTKTQTRRVVKPRRDLDSGCELAPCELAGEVNAGDYFNAAFKPGDRLWVRETWAGPLIDSDALEESHDVREFESQRFCVYAADGGPRPEFISDEHGWCRRWTPSIHMPRWASRITLEVTGVRVERLQDISEADATAEGVSAIPDEMRRATPRCDFQALWQSINGPDSWDANPWVWIVEFRRIES